MQEGLGQNQQVVTDNQNQEEQQNQEQLQNPDNNEQKNDSGEQKNQDKNEEKTNNNQVNDLFNAPETYDYKDVKLPENMKLDTELIEKFNPVAKELNLSQKGADKLMSLAVELIHKNNTNFQELAHQALETQKAKYEQLLENDKEIGGNKLTESLNVANIAYEAFADDEVKSLFEQTGLNKHPAMVKMFLKFGKLCQEDKIHLHNLSGGQETDPAKILYPNMPTTKQV